jgi:hypothetical protein
VLSVIAAACLLAPTALYAQSLSYSSGQNISPAFEGWEEHPDGTKAFIFGYMNRNWVEEIDVPVGPDNTFDRGIADRGQPTHFLPRRNIFVFKVPVPDGFTEKDELVWTLTTKGKTEKAYASLRADYKVDDVVKASETGALGAGTSSPEVRANVAPTVTVQGNKALTAKVGQPITIVTHVADDGIPKPRGAGFSGAAVDNGGSRSDEARRRASTGRPNRAMQPPSRVTVGKNVGLHLSWFVYRGAGEVRFDPEQIKAWEDTRAGANSPWAPVWVAPPMPEDGMVTVHVTFDDPGTYTLRALADDGGLLGRDDVTVTVTP